MAQFIVRNLEDEVRDTLRQIASSQGQSMEELVREILRNRAKSGLVAPTQLGSRISNRFAGHGLNEQISELRGQRIAPPDFNS